MAFENIIDKNFPEWNKKEVNGKTFDEIFQIEGTPLWWFYSRFVAAHTLPSQFNLQRRIEKQSINLFFRAHYNILSFAFKNYFYYNEKIKQKLTKKLSCPGDKVLFLTYTNHYNKNTGKTYRIQKLIELISRGKKIKPLVMYTDPLSRVVSSGIKNFDHTLYGHVDEEAINAAKKEAKNLTKEWKKIDKTLLFGERWELIQPVMDFFFSYEFMYNTLLYYLTSKKIIQEQKVKAVVLTSRNGFFEKCMIVAAQKLNIPTVIIQHGLGLGLFSPETPDGVKHLVFGEIFRERLLRLGVSEKDIIIVGPLLFDEIVPFIRKKNKKEGKAAIITAPFIEENRLSKEAHFRQVEKVIDSLQGHCSEIVIKLHPREKTKRDYEELLAKKGIKNTAVVESMESGQLYSILADASLVINFFSTVALEAMILDRPVLTIDPLVGTSHLMKEEPFTGGVAVAIDGDIAKAVKEALQDREEWKQKRKEMKPLK